MPPPSPRRRRLLVATFAVHLALLTWIVLWKLEVPHVGSGGRHLKLVPFVAGDGYAASAPREVLANVALFVPFGLWVAALTRRRWWLGLAGAALMSAGLEVAQWVLAVGSTDISDVIANSGGAVVGLLLARICLLGFGPRRGRMALARLSVVGTGIALVGCGLFVAGPVHYGPPDVRCDSAGVCQVGHRLAR
ncbi:VanZ family protein [Knoellia subterranea]|uniref:VanZ-like domain-containing protein n=1 Tax=Knoellia subterranea KCTC 19937 TaxID=1385521 RepID=A0A0A0JNF7_9MICO|nr:VanZ family protein [Knoellia subterranea]KGN37562.1 hypothetical protein N803_13380 [Knoellia subterranea KCTC 19937]